MEEIIKQASEFFMSLGYFGIFIMMFLESSFIPFPSEVALLPAGYLIGTKEMSFLPVLFAGTLGSVAGACLNYFLGRTLGRNLLLKYGKYFFLDEDRLLQMEDLFNRRGELIVFLGRFIPVVRQYISFPPGILEMNIFKFSIFTGLGAGIYVAFMVNVGTVYKDYEKLINTYILKYRYLVILLALFYVAYKILKMRKNKKD
ncbi:DedA family protein [Cetobacterium somerae]|uniref:DedA family protein n=1 Tax=Cetobacterium sp. NK01 TaxID=2993530 RepID=UPI00211667AC|nr:DedA family protein [Cetobacterium sp. NK01]MCQ8212206.1 DedA family protein [Cetobacterium sp. NK01]